MIDKHKSIQDLINSIIKIFGKDTFEIKDHWDDFFAIGFESNKKLIYISTYKLKPKNYSYECEILLDDEETPYMSYDRAENVSFERIIKVIENFFKVSSINHKVNSPK